MILLPSQLQNAFLTFDTKFQQVYAETPTHWQKFATEMPSNTDSEVHAWIAKLPQLREWVGPRTVNNITARTQTVQNKKYEGTFAVERTKIEDDKIGVYAPAVAELARQAKLWPDKIVTDALIAGTSAVTFDGQKFFDAAHPINMNDPASLTQSNLLGTSPLSATTYAAARAAMMNFKAEDGVPLELEPDLLIVPPALEQTGREILHADTLPQSFSNTSTIAAAAGKTNIWKSSAELLVLPRLTADSASSWYLGCTKMAIKPLIFQNRMAPEFTPRVNPEDPVVFDRDEFLFGVRARGAGAYGLWFLMIKCTA
jgi:phage major head subunit gpT-like protein